MLGKLSLVVSVVALGVAAAAHFRTVEPAPLQLAEPQGQGAPQGDEIRAYLLENPEVIMEAFAAYERKQKEQEAARDETLVAENAQEIFDDGYSHVTGNLEGDVTLVEFLDYNCGYCKRAHAEVEKFVEQDGNIRLVIKEFPILGAGSILAARAALASAMQQGAEKYDPFYDALMTHRGTHDEASVMRIAEEVGLDLEALREDMESEAVGVMIRRTYDLAEKLNINGTPAFVIGSEVVRGFVPAARLEALAKAAREG